MTDEERLEEIKNNDISYLLYGTKLKDYWEWLIEQAERAQELEEFKQAMEDRYKIWHNHLVKSWMEINRDEKIEKVLGFTKQEYDFSLSWFLFVAIGLVGFGFTLEQIEQAYFKKNKVNHERQDNGY